MIAFEVRLNGNKVCTAGLEHRGVLQVGVALDSTLDKERVRLNVAGMEIHTEAQLFSKLAWISAEPRAGDVVTIAILEGATIDQPQRLSSHMPAEGAEVEKMVEKRDRAQFERLKRKYGW